MKTFAQGEIYGREIDALPADLVAFDEKLNGAWVISHSESGHHHVIDAGCATVMEHPSPPKGMRILYAIVDSPTQLRQDAADAHEAHDLDGGSIYEMRIAREYDPFTEQARRVTD